MADERKKQPDDIDPDAPPSAEEIAASQRLRDALEDPSLPDDDADLARALKAAWAPEALEADAIGAIVEGALDPEESRAALALRDALDGRAEASSPEAALAQALACAWNPKPLSDAEHEAILARALGTNVVAFRRRTITARVTFGVAGVLAVAASLFLVVKSSPRGEGEIPLARSRSTQELFTEPFQPGEASARIDRIAMARASDYRDNRFAKWGVR
jgi:hypothetical protein